MSRPALPLTFDECRARFRRSALELGVVPEAHPIAARGPDEQVLTIESLSIGATDPRRALVVMSGVHGVEGFIGSALQCEWLRELVPATLPDDMVVLCLHAVNPWGMAWWRRQNESNVDLNRNWRRDSGLPFRNAAYEVLHPVLCPDQLEPPDVDAALAAVRALARERGEAWVRDGITVGQYGHPDGLHYGGSRTEASTRIVEDVVGSRLRGVERMLTIDLHTGHGAYGLLTLLCNQPPASPQHRFLTTLAGADVVEATTGNRDATTGRKAGQIANGFADLFPDACCFATTAEFGTASAGRQLVNTILEQWSYRHGRRDDAVGRELVWNYRSCFSPDDPGWIQASSDRGRALLRSAFDAVAQWTGEA